MEYTKDQEIVTKRKIKRKDEINVVTTRQEDTRLRKKINVKTKKKERSKRGACNVRSLQGKEEELEKGFQERLD